jgi:hypothetical protein
MLYPNATEVRYTTSDPAPWSQADHKVKYEGAHLFAKDFDVVFLPDCGGRIYRYVRATTGVASSMSKLRKLLEDTSVAVKRGGYLLWGSLQLVGNLPVTVYKNIAVDFEDIASELSESKHFSDVLPMHVAGHEDTVYMCMHVDVPNVQLEALVK